MLRNIEFLDVSPLASLPQFLPFVMEKLHPRTVMRLIRQAYTKGILYSIDVEGDPLSPREVCILRAVPGQAPIEAKILEFIPYDALFVAKGAHAEHKYLSSKRRTTVLTERGGGLIDIAPYTAWAKEKRKHHRAVDGAAQALSRAMDHATGCPSIFGSVFSKEKTEMFLDTMLPRVDKSKIVLKYQHQLVRGQTNFIPKRQRTADETERNMLFKGFCNEDTCPVVVRSRYCDPEDLSRALKILQQLHTASEEKIYQFQQQGVELINDRLRVAQKVQILSQPRSEELELPLEQEDERDLRQWVQDNAQRIFQYRRMLGLDVFKEADAVNLWDI